MGNVGLVRDSLADEILSAVDDGELLELAKGVLAIPSHQQNEQRIGQYVAEQMDRLGFEVDLQEVVNGRCNVIGVLPGSGDGANVLLNGHLDGPLFSGWTRDPFAPALEGDWLYGTGVTDMKGGLAGLIAGAAALGRVRSFPRGDVVMSAVMYHDTVGLGMKFYLASNDTPFAYGINGEPSSLRIHVHHGSAIQIEATLSGKEAHTSLKHEGDNAIGHLARFLTALDESCLTYTPHPELPDLPRIVVGSVRGADSVSIMAREASALFDVRGVPGMTPATVKADVRRLAERLGIQLRLHTYAYQKPMMGTRESPVVEALKWAHQRVLGRPTEVSSRLPTQAYITDASDMQREGIETAVYGPCDLRVMPDERASWSEMRAAARVYALAAAELATLPAPG